MEQWREDILIHYGVKGMKWGRTRQKIASPKLGYFAVRPKKDYGSNEEANYMMGKVRFRPTIYGAVSNKQQSHDQGVRVPKGKTRSEWQKQTETELRKEIVNQRLGNAKRRDKEDNTYNTTKDQRRKYKVSQAKNKIKKLSSKFGINFKQYK